MAGHGPIRTRRAGRNRHSESESTVTALEKITIFKGSTASLGRGHRDQGVREKQDNSMTLVTLTGRITAVAGENLFNNIIRTRKDLFEICELEPL